MTAADNVAPPEGWALTRLDALVRPSRERAEPEDYPNAPYLSLEHIQSDTGRIVGRGVGTDVRSTKTIFRAGDVLYGKLRPYLNKVCIPSFDGICSTDFLVFPRSERIDSRFLQYFLSRGKTVQFANHHMSGVQLPRISFEKLGELEVPLPSLGEQRRIATQVDGLQARARATLDNLAKVSSTLRRFRQAVLTAACSGRLTADWRYDHRQAESAAKLIDRLRGDRDALASDVVGAEPFTGATLEQTTDLPDTWAMVEMGLITSHITSGSRDWSKYYGRGTATFIMAQNIRRGRLDLGHRQTVDPPTHSRDRERTAVRRGDLLVTIVGANTGDVCRIEVDLPEHFVCQSVALMRPRHPALTPYLNLYLNSDEHGRRQYEEFIYGEGRPHLSFDQLRATLIALPPLEEQLEIVRRTDRLFSLADATEHRVEVATKRANDLNQAILDKAFRGELVRMDAGG